MWPACLSKYDMFTNCWFDVGPPSGNRQCIPYIIIISKAPRYNFSTREIIIILCIWIPPDLCSATPMRYGPGSALLSLGTLRFIPLIVVTLGISCHDTSLICVTNRCLVAELIIRWEKESTLNTPSILCPVILSTFLGKLPHIKKHF